MATNYSLIVWGGVSGKTSTSYNTTTDVVTLSNHGLQTGLAVVAQATTSGLTSGTTYYARYISSSTFSLHTSAAGAAADTGKVDLTGSTQFTLKSKYYTDITDATRWGNATPASARIYASLSAWNTGRAAAAGTDVEVCEIGEAFTDVISAVVNINVPAGACRIETKVNGTRSGGFHSGVISQGSTYAGYVLFGTHTNNTLLNISSPNVTVDGFTVRIDAINNNYGGIALSGLSGVAKNMIAFGAGNYGSGLSIGITGVSSQIHNCVSANWSSGLYLPGYTDGMIVANNTFTNNNTGMNCITYQPVYVYAYNNISVGNTTNYQGTFSGFKVCTKNAGLVGEAWMTAGGSRITIATTDFANYGSYDLSPANSSSPQVDAGTEFYGIISSDVQDAERPNYNNGGSEAHDVGAYEFDHGYGNHPLVRSLDISGLVTGSQVVTYTTNTATELDRVASTAGSTYSYDAGQAGVTVDFTILKAGYKPIRITGFALTAESNTYTAQQDLDRAYAAPSGLTFGTTIGVGGCNFVAPVTSLAVTSVRVAAATTVQNWYSAMMDAFIANSTNTSLKNVPFPIAPFGEASFTLLNGVEFSDGATSIAYLSRDGLRYSSDAGVTATAIWSAILTLNTPSGFQVKYRQATAGTITNAANTGPMDQLVQVYGDASHGNFDYRGHMVLRCPKPGYSQPQPDIVGTYGNLYDGLFVAALEPVLQYATTNADLDAANLALDNTAKTYTITASHTMAELYQRAQWWANQDAQWDADIPLTTSDGSTFTQPSNWSMTGVAYLTGGTLAGGAATLAAGTQGIAYSGVTLTLGAEGTYTFTMAGSCTVKTNPTADNVHYIFGAGTFNGTLTVNNLNAHPIVVEVPAGTTTSTTGNTGGAITFQSPSIYQSVTVNGITTTSRVRIYDTDAAAELYNGIPGTTSYTWTDPTPAAAPRPILLRVSDVTGTTAKQFIDQSIGTCATSGSGKDISYLVSQSADPTYNANAVDGSAVTGITFVDSGSDDRVNCNIPGGTAYWKNIYAAFVYWNYTATGIANDFTYIAAPDTANYLLSGMKVKNTGSGPLTILGGYGRDATTGAVADIIDTTGGNIYPAPDHVVPYQTTGTYAITGDISTVLAAIPSASTNAAAVLSAAASAPIAADVKKMNGYTVNGDGTAGNLWRGA